MKKIIFYSVLLVILLISNRHQTQAIGLTDFGLNVGLATPNEHINDVYNSSSFQYEQNDQEQTGQFLKEAAELGYHIGMNLRFGLSENAYIVGGVALNRFPETTFQVIDPETQEHLATITSTTNIVPISAGINLYVLRSLVGIYGIGELQYNYITNSVDVEYQDINFPLTNSPTDSRIGAAIGAGFDFDLQVLLLALEAKYNFSNIIQVEDEENSKSYLTLTLGVYF